MNFEDKVLKEYYSEPWYVRYKNSIFAALILGLYFMLLLFIFQVVKVLLILNGL